MKKIESPTQTLMNQALALCKSNTLDELRDKTGIPSSWLRKFRSNKIPNPSVNRVEKILTSFEVSKITLSK